MKGSKQVIWNQRHGYKVNVMVFTMIITDPWRKMQLDIYFIPAKYHVRLDIL